MNKTAIHRLASNIRLWIESYWPNQTPCFYFDIFFHLIASLYCDKNQILLQESLSAFFPELFTKQTEDLLQKADRNVLKQWIATVEESDWKKPEILGWLYQAYRIPDKDAAFEQLKNGNKITEENLPAATQLFTPEWIVRYLVQNSLGNLWMRIHPNSILYKEWDYYLPTSVAASEHRMLTDLRIIDPCMGSGHILIYCFELLFQMYREEGQSPESAVENILRYNLYGLDLDDSVSKIAYFALIMKAFHYVPTVLLHGCRPQVYGISGFAASMPGLPLQFGSLVNPGQPDSVQPVIRLLSQRYDAVITNPPYMGKKNLNVDLSRYMAKHYPEGKSELYAAFMLRCTEMTVACGYTAMITIHSWMFIRSYEMLRHRLLHTTGLLSLVHSGAGTFEELNAFNVLACAFVLQKTPPPNKSIIIRLCEQATTEEKCSAFLLPENRYEINQKKFFDIPGSPLVYHISEAAAANFKKMSPLKFFAKPKQGIATADNATFVRYWFEVPKEQICFHAESANQAINSGCRFFPYNKGGYYRKWYGMNEYVIDWENGGARLYNSDKAVLRNMGDQFKEGITWSLFGFENFGVRYKTSGFLFDVSGSSAFPPKDQLLYTLAFLASKTAFLYLSILAPTVNFQVGNIAQLPFHLDETIKPNIDRLAACCIQLAKEDWDDYEMSWDFTVHPLIKHQKSTIRESFHCWEDYAKQRYDRLVSAEEEINRLFIRSYGLEADMTPQIPNRDVSVRLADVNKDIRSFLSFAVGCMFGRYRLSIDSKDTYLPTDINLLTPAQMTEELQKLVSLIWGQDGLEDNMSYLASVVGKGDNPRQILTHYFTDRFFVDHMKTYQKHPIYFQYDSRKKNGFTAFFYYHRFTSEQLSDAKEAAIQEGDQIFADKLDALIKESPYFDAAQGIKNNYRRFASVLSKLW